MSSNLSISVQSKKRYDPMPVLGGTTGRVVYAFLDLEEQERVKKTSKRCIPTVEYVQKQQIAQLFPKEYLHLVGGSVDKLKNLPVRVFTRPKPFAPSYPDHFIGWTQTRANVFVLHVFKRERDRYNSYYTNHLVYHLAPKAPEKQDDKTNEGVPSKASPAALFNVFIRYWTVDGPDGPCCFKIRPCCCQPNYLCWPPSWCWWLGLSCNCTKTLPIEQDFPQRGNRNEYIIPAHERVEEGPTLRYHGIPYIPKPPEPPVNRERKPSVAQVWDNHLFY